MKRLLTTAALALGSCYPAHADKVTDTLFVTAQTACQVAQFKMAMALSSHDLMPKGSTDDMKAWTKAADKEGIGAGEFTAHLFVIRDAVFQAELCFSLQAISDAVNDDANAALRADRNRLSMRIGARTVVDDNDAYRRELKGKYGG